MNRGDRLQPTPRVFVAYARSGPLPKKRTYQQDTYQLILELSNNPDKKPSLFYTRKYFPKILEHCYYAIREHPFNLIYPYLKFSETLSIATCLSSNRRSDHFYTFKKRVREIQQEVSLEDQLFTIIRFATGEEAPLPYNATNGFSLLNLAGELSRKNLDAHRRAVHCASRPEQRDQAQRQCEELERTITLVERLNEYPKGHLRDRLRQVPEQAVQEFINSLYRKPQHYIWNHDKGFESGTPLHFTPRRNARSSKKVLAFARELAKEWSTFPTTYVSAPLSKEYKEKLRREQEGDPRQGNLFTWKIPF
ncbi:hypothetical protein D6774_01990 [Candidatus Woesearchaeota archaeon]|nr:MAG: hypothetical protein D6774_01990 [Candidatus Woesearchaeota archaeon]